MTLPLTVADRAEVNFISEYGGSRLGISVSLPLSVDQNVVIASLQQSVTEINTGLTATNTRVDTLAQDGPAAAELAALEDKIDTAVVAADQRVDALNDLVVSNINRVVSLENTPEIRRLYLFDTRAALDATGTRYHQANTYVLVVTGNQQLISDGVATWNTATNVPALAATAGVEIYGNLSVADAASPIRAYGLTGLEYKVLQEYIP